MSKLTDLELCKRIAEIEGIEATDIDGDLRVNICIGIGGTYNPLLNKALLWDLMVKYKVEIDYDANECSIFGDDPREFMSLSTLSFSDDDLLPRAILTAIVEADK